MSAREQDLTDSRPLEKKRTVTFDKLLDAVALGNREPEVLESLAGRLVRLEKRFDEALALRCAMPRKAKRSVRSPKLCSPQPIPTISKPRPRKVKTNIFNRQRKTCKQRKVKLMQEAVAPLATNPALRQLLIKIHQASEQVIDVITRDRVLFAGAVSTNNAKRRTSHHLVP